MRVRFSFASLRWPGILVLLLAGGMSIGLTDDLSPDLLLLARFKQKVRQDFGRLSNCTCLETIERSVREPGTNSFHFLDRVRLEVTTAGEKELLTWPGGGHFEDWAVTSFVKSGLVASGMFASYARNLFLTNVATFRYGGVEELEGRRTVRYDFKVPRLSSLYRLRSGNDAAAVATKGSFWFDADSLQLVRLDQFADDIPAGLELTGALTRILYGRMPDMVPDVLLPQSAEIELRHPSGEVRRNKVEFAQCREYRAESSISFDSPGPGTEASQAEPARVELPAGLKIEIELESAFDSATAAIGDPVRARVVEDVRRGKPIVPKGAIATGRIRSMERQARAGGFLLGIELNGMRWENKRAEFHAELLEVRNGDPLKRARDLQANTVNIIPLTGSTPSMEASIPEHSGAPTRLASRIAGVGMVYVKGEQWRLQPGLHMVWRTLIP